MMTIRGVRVFAAGCLAVLAACAGGRPGAVSPDEIPELEARLEEQPENGDLLLRYAAALFAAGRCDSATVVARNGATRRPESALAPLVIGQCQERMQNLDGAVATYRAFLEQYPEDRGSAAVRAREMLVVRERANARAREALAREAELATQPGDPQTLAVMPLEIQGDSTYQPLSRGLAQLIAADLSLLQRFRLVERVQVQALLAEMQLGERVDPATAARAGRLLQAGRLMQGIAAIPSENQVQLSASVVQSDGEILAPSTQSGRLRDLLRMEKEIVIEVAARLGYTLTEAERQRILENGTQNLAAFLAYSRGLAAEDAGDYSAAATHYQNAVRADPGFQAAREQQQAVAAAPAVQTATASEVTTVAATQTTSAEAMANVPVADAVASSVADVAATTSEQTAATPTQQTTTQATATPIAQPPPTTTAKGTTTTVTGVVRIVFRLP